MAENPTWLAVVAAAIRDVHGRLLLQQALPGKRHALLWEFPGGKVESEENPRFALVREVREELDLTLDPAACARSGLPTKGLPTAGRRLSCFFTIARSGAVRRERSKARRSAGSPPPRRELSRWLQWTLRCSKLLAARGLPSQGAAPMWRPPSAPVAQLDRVPDYESGGRRFESFRARQFPLLTVFGARGTTR